MYPDEPIRLAKQDNTNFKIQRKMRTITLSNGSTCHIADLSLEAAMREIKNDFRTMPFREAWEKNLDDINYIISLGVKRRCDIVRALRSTSEFAGMYSA